MDKITDISVYWSDGGLRLTSWNRVEKISFLA